LAISKDGLSIKNGRNYVVKFNRYINLSTQENKLSSHSFPEINFFISGTGKYMIDNCTFDFKPGDIFFIPPGATHMVTKRNETSDHLNIWFAPDALKLDIGKGKKTFNDIFAGIKINERILFDSLHPNYEVLRRIVLEIYDEIRKKRGGYIEMVKIKIMELTMLLVREYEHIAGGASLLASPRVEAIDNVLEYIQDALNKSFTLNELSKIANMSPSHFGAVFKDIIGITPWEYITSKKMELAQNLLKETDKQVMDIVYECGYSNIANFNRAFKKYTNMTPTKYRKVLIPNTKNSSK